MTNQDIAKKFQLLGKLMELHGENPFKIKSYQNAYRTLKSLDKPVKDLKAEDLSKIKGVGKAISGKIRELVETGSMNTLDRYADQTPEGIREMLGIKGFGAKKIRVIWQELGVESIGELLYAVNENRLLDLKGFGEKTQNDLKEKLKFYQLARDKYHYASLAPVAKTLLERLIEVSGEEKIEFTGAIRRKDIVLGAIEIIAISSISPEKVEPLFEAWNPSESGLINGKFQSYPVILHLVEEEEFGTKQLELTGNDLFYESLPEEKSTNYRDEATLLQKLNLPDIPPVARVYSLDQLNKVNFSEQELITLADIKGVLHVHTTYSDGVHSLSEVVEAAANLGYRYIGITDHSRSAFYANGLSVERLLQQIEEIDQLQERFEDITIFKGIESDILSNGDLDYEDEILEQLDFVIASVHSNLKMEEAKATERLLKAIESPYTKILGHPTGRLLLSRPGYSLNYEKIFDACAANEVAIELNANPYRLDLDWSLIPRASEKGIKISINPDAHRKSGIEDIQYGVIAARKGLLAKSNCLNFLDVEAFRSWITRR